MQDSHFIIGKHKGKSFDYVYENDTAYVQWVLGLGAPTGQLGQFIKFCKVKRGLLSPDVLENYAFDAETCTPAAPVQPTPPGPVKRHKTNAAENDDKEWLHDMQTIDQLLGASTNLQDSLNGAKGVTNGKCLHASLGHGPLSGGTSSLHTSIEKSILMGYSLGCKPKSKLLKEEDVLALVLYSPCEFFVTHRKRNRDSYTAWTLYLPQHVFHYLKALGFTHQFKPMSKDKESEKCVCFEACHYQAMADALKKDIPNAGNLELVPKYILDVFAAFKIGAKSSKGLSMTSNLGQNSKGDDANDFKASDYLLAKKRLGEELFTTLKPFQIEGVLFALQRGGKMLLGDEMGLGKTLQALGVCAFYYCNWPLLVICPSSLRFQWRDQCLKWLPHLCNEENVCVIKTNKTVIPMETRVVICSYDMITQNQHFRHKFEMVVVDESHYLKNKGAKRTQCLVPLIKMAKRIVLLSGTPTLNMPSELYQQISCLIPNFCSNHAFVERYCERKLNWFTKRFEYVGAKHTHELHLFLVTTIMIRRLKENVLSELPPKIRSRVTVELPKAFISQTKASLKSFKSNDVPGFNDDQDLLRQGTNGKGKSSGYNQGTIDADILKSSSPQEVKLLNIQRLFQETGVAKCKAICDYVTHLLKSGNKFIIFGHHMVVLDSIEETLKQSKVGYIRIDGSTHVDKREVYVNTFQKDPKCIVAVLSLTACGTGLNLTSSSIVVFAELHWVPGQMIQAEDRAHRIGTTHKTINVYYLIAQDSVVETVWRVLSRKWASVTSTLDGYKDALSLAKPANDKQQEEMNKLMKNQRLIAEFINT